MLECEVKLLDIDLGEVTKLLERIGATYLGDQLLVDVYLNNSGMKVKKRSRARVRFSEKETVFTLKFKLPSDTTKLAYEFDTRLSNEFGFSKDNWNSYIDHIRIKKRISYTWGGYHFDIDQYRGLPTLLEIEGPNAQSIHQIITGLGLTKYEQFTGGGKALYSYYTAKVPKVSYGFFTRLLSLIRCG